MSEIGSLNDASALELLSQDHRDLLDTVDDLRSMGVGRIVDLPQIIVVGDQSSGKSSVLEAISLVRFPVKGGLCTRFATELVLRKAQETSFRVSIIVTDSSSTSKLDNGASVRRFNETSWANDDLSNVIEEAKKAMGIGNNDYDFSDDVLRIEISRPELPSLTLIDLPGFYHGETSEQSANGRKTVRKLARKYMERKNSIILAIVSGSYGLANQKVLNEARQYDPSRQSPSVTDPQRTLGILTKPDTITPGTDDEEKYLQLIQNKESANRLELGWHVLRNRAGNEIDFTDEDRDTKESEFFNQGVWKNIRPGDKGIRSLRSKLSRVLVDHIKKSLPSVREDIERNIEEKRRSLKDLGTPRSSPEQIRQYLGEISGKVLGISMEAIRGTGYNDPFFGDSGSQWSLVDGVFSNARRLRAVVRNLNQTFATVIKVMGETRKIVWEEDTVLDDEDDPDYVGASEDETEDEAEEDGDSEDAAENGKDEDSTDPVQQVYRELAVALAPKLLIILMEYKIAVPKPIPIWRLEEEIRSLSLEYLGSQFPGSPNDYLAVQLFKGQSQKWEDIAKQHLALMLAAAKSFTEAVVAHVVAADEKTREAILFEIVDPFFRERKSILEAKLEELLYHYKMGIPQPLDDKFQNALSSMTKDRVAGRLKSALSWRDKTDKITPEMAIHVYMNERKRTNEYTKAIDMMFAYYQISLDTFTDNVRILAAENCLISVLPRILTPDMVNKMTDERLVALAAESDEIREERDHLRGQLDILQQGLEKCRRYGGRHYNAIVSPGNQNTTPSSNPRTRRDSADVQVQDQASPYQHQQHEAPDTPQTSSSEDLAADPKGKSPSSSVTSPADTNVLICGSGSAGLTAALWLARYGVPFRILERRNGPLLVGQADGVQSRTVEIFESFGISDVLLRESYHVQELAFWAPDRGTPHDGGEDGIKRSYDAPDIEPGLSHQPHVILSQARVNEIITEEMLRSGGPDIDYGYDVKGVEVDGTKAVDPEAYPVTVTAVHNGVEQVFRAKYVLGSDDAHSAVRKALGFKMVGTSTDALWGVMDVYPRTDFPDIRKKAVIQSANGTVIIIPREGDSLVRIYTELPPDTVASQVTLEDLHKRAKLVLRPYELDIAETTWWSTYVIGQKLADNLHEKYRVFLTGDACHTHSPKAGQGMNVSLQDGYNIGWKLGAYLTGQASVDLVKTYVSERQATAAELIEFDREWDKLVKTQSSAQQGDNAAAPGAALARDLVMRAGSYTAGQAYKYGKSLIVWPSEGERVTSEVVELSPGKTKLVVGMRFANAQIVRYSDAKVVQLLSTIKADRRWRIVVFAGDVQEERVLSALEKVAASIEPVVKEFTPEGQDQDSTIESLLALKTKRTELELYQIPEFFRPAVGKHKIRGLHKVFVDDESYHSGHGHAFDKLGIDPNAITVAVIRPDQYTSLVVSGQAIDSLGQFFKGFLKPQM
ncbi:hypothetical protein VPNG_02146 [Cytospora leucostoma]|uniref:GED domain-containing protein n=1 Tax=Cytospora leucostoma TaxID=1230097 RepID=A0A423XGZ7_9PEZI|nr:hypothetical protein VPNG_02146 [Cytospora leucostoma]